MQMQLKLVRFIVNSMGISILLLSLTGCVSSLKGNAYSHSEARQIQQVAWGTLLNISPVVIEGQQSNVARLPGAIIGGIAGSSIGEGKGQKIFTTLGAVTGIALGTVLAKELTAVQGVELTIYMDSGETLSIIQEVDDVATFRKKQRVRVLTQGRLARVSPE